jgi:site-specific recombinase XerD
MFPEVLRFRKWLRRRSPHASTHQHYTYDLKLFFDWTDKPPNAITIQDVDAFIEHCQQLGHSVATVNRRLDALRSFYHFLDLDAPGSIPNPVLPRRHFVSQGRRLPRDAEDADVERLFAVIHGPRDRAMFLLMLRCGLRVQETHNLSLGDLYLQPTSPSLPRLWVRGKKGCQRVAYLSSQAFVALEAWLAIRPIVEDQAVFLSYSGQRLGIRGIQKRLAHYCRLAGVQITCHQLRHTFGRHLVEAGMPVTSIRLLLGHQRLRTTQLYTRISDSQLQADYEAAIEEITRRFNLGVRDD